MKWEEKPKKFIVERAAAFIMTCFLAALVLSLIYGFFAWIWESKPIQRNFFPKDYWEKKANELESEIEFYEGMLQNAKIELEKKEMVMDLEIKQTMQLNKALGIDPVAVREEVAAKRRAINAEIQQLKDEVVTWRKRSKEARRLLYEARREFLRYR